MKSEFEQLSGEWHQVFGTDIPAHIAKLPSPQIREALEHGRRRYRPVSETSGNDDSMMDYDNHKQH